jgi:hypothetical protein
MKFSKTLITAILSMEDSSLFFRHPATPQRGLFEDTYLGQWIIYTANLSMRIAQLEVEVENSRNVLAGEATAPWVLGRASFFGGGEGGEFGRELLFPQDRYVLSGLSQGPWERLDEKLVKEAKRKQVEEGKMAAKVRGGRAKPRKKGWRGGAHTDVAGTPTGAYYMDRYQEQGVPRAGQGYHVRGAWSWGGLESRYRIDRQVGEHAIDICAATSRGWNINDLAARRGEGQATERGGEKGDQGV